MDTATAWIERQGTDGIGLGIRETNARVIPFYERLGYRDTGMRVAVHDDPGRQIMIMGRRLKE